MTAATRAPSSLSSLRSRRTVAPWPSASQRSSTCISHAHAICAIAVSLPSAILAPQCSMKARSRCTSWRWPILTAFGSPVEPEVKIMYASAPSASNGETGDGGGGGARCALSSSARRPCKKGVRKRGASTVSPAALFMPFLFSSLASAFSHAARRSSLTTTSAHGVASESMWAMRCAGSDESTMSHAQPRSRQATIATQASTLRSQRMGITNPGFDKEVSSLPLTCSALCSSCQYVSDPTAAALPPVSLGGMA
mmetsp:Transcript_58955/g.117127  ORF Transcript_58955/g.117127 Transcript_58955/m.117127 type:complete len:253 (-) Transcript_58955:4026-4784(-)